MSVAPNPNTQMCLHKECPPRLGAVRPERVRQREIEREKERREIERLEREGWVGGWVGGWGKCRAFLQWTWLHIWPKEMVGPYRGTLLIRKRPPP